MIHSDRSVSRFLTRVSKKVPDYYRLQQKISRLSPVLSVVGSIIYVFIKSFFLLRFKRKMLFLTRNNRQKKKTYPKRYILKLHLITLSALFATLIVSISGCLLVWIIQTFTTKSLIAHYIGLSTLTASEVEDISKYSYRPLYRAVYNNI